MRVGGKVKQNETGSGLHNCISLNHISIDEDARIGTIPAEGKEYFYSMIVNTP